MDKGTLIKTIAGLKIICPNCDFHTNFPHKSGAEERGRETIKHCKELYGCYLCLACSFAYDKLQDKLTCKKRAKEVASKRERKLE